MADNRIRFSIESVFHGEGFAKASKAVSSTSGTVKNALEGVGKLSSSLGGLTGTAGQVADGMGKVFGVFTAAGGPIGIAIASITLLVGWMQKLKSEAEEQKKKQAELAKQMEEGYRKKMAEAAAAAAAAIERAMQISIKGAEAAIAKVDRLTKSYKTLAASQREIGSAETRLATAKLDLEVALGGSDLDKVRAEIKKAGLKYAQSMDEAADAEMEAHKELEAWKEKIKRQQEVVHALELACEDSTAAQAKLAEMATEMHAAEDRLKARAITREAIETEREATLAGLEQKERELMVKEEELAAAVAERADREGDAAVRAAERANAEDLARLQIDDLTEKTKDEIAAIDRKIAAEDALIARINQLHQNAQGGMAADANHTNGSFGGYKYQTDANGNISDFEDWQRANRFNEGVGANDRANASAHDKHLQGRYDKLREKAEKGKKLTDDEKRFMDQWDDYQDQKKDVKDEQKKRQDLENERKKIIDKLGKDVDEIKKNLKKALEVQ